MPSTASFSVSSAPKTEPIPTTKLTTPSGKPASTTNSTSSRPTSGISEEGFITTALPAASAGSSFQPGVATGKFQGVISETTPSGSRMI